MLTPAFPNRGNRHDLLAELKKQMYEYLHYLYVEEGRLLANLPVLEDIEQHYEEFNASPNTVLFWSSKTRLHSPKLIYSIRHKIIVFDKVIGTERDDFSWISKSMHLAALGIRLWLKEDVNFIQLPKKFAESSASEAAAEGDYILVKLDELYPKKESS